MENTLGEKVQATIFDDLGLSNLPTEEKQALLEQMTELAMQRAMVVVAKELDGKLSEAEVEGMSALPAEQQFAEMAKHVPNFMEIIEKELMQVRSELTELVK